MEIEVNRLLELEYLNSLVSRLSTDINEIKSNFLKQYSLDVLKGMDADSINSLFSQYGVGNNAVLQLSESDFIDNNWEFADLFHDDILYSSELKEEIKFKALEEVELLNNEINAINQKYQINIEDLEKKLKFVNAVIRLLNCDGTVLTSDIDNLMSLLIGYEFSDEDKFIFSCEIVKNLIEKIRLVSKDVSRIDTIEFENILDEAYESSEYNEVVETVDEPVYSETVLSYYKYYKDLFNEEGLGENLAQVMDTAYGLSMEVDISASSVTKESFCIKLASLLYVLNETQKKEKVDQDVVADVLMDLTILDRIYEVDIQYNDYKKKRLEEINNDLAIIVMLDIDCLFKDRIKNKLSLLQIELNNNLINDKRKNEIELEYKSIKHSINKLPEIVKQLKTLDKLNNKIIKMLSVSNSSFGYMTDEYYTNLNDLQIKILELMDMIGTMGSDASVADKILDYEKNISRYMKVEKQEKKVNLKGFVLFDFDENNRPYVIDDLDPDGKHNSIDESILKDKLNSGFQDYKTLINDLLIYGIPRIMMNGTPNFAGKILDNVYYNNDRNYPTEMVIIRPMRNSLVRFVSQEVILKPNTEMYRQVSSIIQEIVPNVKINMDEEFSLYINFSSLIKRKEIDSYQKAINRYLRKSPLYRMFIEQNEKIRLTDEECGLLRDIVHMSLDAYSKLEEKNDSLRFDVINQIGGKRTRG